eukprot:tig00020554_g10924.t1
MRAQQQSEEGAPAARKSRRSFCACAASLVAYVIVTAHPSAARAAEELQEFEHPDSYRFLYPARWVRDEDASPGKNRRRPKGPEVGFTDLFDPAANVSVVVSGLPPGDFSVRDLGEPREVAEKLVRTVVAPQGSGRTAKLVRTGIVEKEGVEYLEIELVVRGKDWTRRSFTALAMRPNSLYSFTLQLPEGNSFKGIDSAAILGSFRVL